MRTSVRAVIALVLAAPLALGIGGVASATANSVPASAMVLTDKGHPGHDDGGNNNGSHGNNHHRHHSGSDTDSSDGNSGVDGNSGTTVP
ncbi:hypothetical protein MOQ72_26045 [Saccharopolyspora sp. K220]|uniref:hypothetical protein n=1 Tax=Saccharopolyspora soli TaxID=2926618 RepID=UPI001F58CE4C|nr:hypothetical protein [Saccharopolyspora soli]MCI2420910.1 hypothetical protein [Saccharopolyspora soli]